MTTELQVHAVHEGGMRFTASAGGHAVTLDYPFRLDEVGAGPTPLQMLLMSLAACSGSTVALVLERMKQPFAGLEVDARATRSDEHPTVLTEIALIFTIRGVEVQPETVQKALDIAETQLCPVWAMLKAGTPIAASYRLVND